ncbi:MAG: CPBP family intramembrane metalloprotease [Bacteroidales bacterium]|jgi:membrane protease YdiL (CAAX protease family)|nr:CPBP family intramembrane metalloprotease [Bacteroidales bacterium]
MIPEHYLSAVIITVIIVLLYVLYYITVYTKVQHWIYRTFAHIVNETVFRAVFSRLSGFILFGLVTVLIFKQVYGTEFNFLSMPEEHFSEICIWCFVLTLFVIFIAYLNVKKSKENPYPQFKIDKWTNSYKLLSYISWIFYLSGYEFMFRGVLLFGTVDKIGYYPATILNVVLYALVHIPKGKKEVLGCFLMGPILCLLAIRTQSIVIPIIVHIALCLSNEYFSIQTVILNQKKINSNYEL